MARRAGTPGYLALLALMALVLAAVAVGTRADADTAVPSAQGDQSFYILPPGNFGGLPTTAQSTDQLPLYDGLTPLRGNITQADIASHFLPENLAPVGTAHEEVTGRPGLRILYDSYGIPHITGKTQADVAFGAGWVSAR